MVKKYAGLSCNDLETKIKNLVITIRFLKSTDDDMLKTLETMSGVTHRSRADSKTITSDMGNVTNLNRNKGEMSYNIATKEEPVISFNDMAFIPDRNSMVFRAGDSPIWNRQEMILPMSWRLFSNTIVNPGHDYSLQTIPTLSTAMDFDVRKNQPDFNHWFNKRLSQMTFVDAAVEKYKDLHGYSDRDIELLDPDIYADDIMRIVHNLMNPNKVSDDDDYEDNYNPELDRVAQAEELMMEAYDNTEVIDKAKEFEAQQKEFTDKIYAGGLLSKGDFVDISGNVRGHSWDGLIRKLFIDEWQKFFDDKDNFYVTGDRQSGFSGSGDLCSTDVHDVYIRVNRSANAQIVAQLQEDSTDENTRVFAESKEDIERYGSEIATMEVTDKFYKYLVTLTPQEFSKVAGGALQARLISELKDGTQFKK